LRDSFDAVFSFYPDELLFFLFFCLGFPQVLGQNIFVNRKNHEAAIKSMDDAGKAIVERKAAVVLFPEGTRNRVDPRTLLPFKKGAFHIAIKAQVCIASCAVPRLVDCQLECFSS
jgi:1-acyl-sn-glycerol-3-phosphate acyltransferase